MHMFARSGREQNGARPGNVSRTMVIEIKYFSANNAVIHLNRTPRDLEMIIIQNCGIEESAAKRALADHPGIIN